MNLRSILFRAALAAALFGFALGAAALAPRLDTPTRTTTNHFSPFIAFPLVALPLVQALLSP